MKIIEGRMTLVTLPLLRKKTVEVNIEDIVYIESSDSICFLIKQFNNTVEKIPINCTLTEIEDIVNSTEFYKIHRSLIVNLKYVVDYGEYPTSTIHLKASLGNLPLSKRRRLHFHNAYKALRN